MKHKHRFAGYVVAILIILIISSSVYFFPGIEKFISPENIRSLLISSGVWGYLIFISLLMLSIPLPLPSAPIVLTGGYVYGAFLGTLLSLLANIIGATIAFYLVRWNGLPLLEKLVDKHHIIHFNHLFKKRGLIVAFTSYVIPIFPSDAVSMLLGLTKIRYHIFLFLLIIGHIPRYILITTFGNDIFTGFTTQSFIILAGVVLLLLIALFRERIKRILYQELHDVEREIKKIERELEGGKKTQNKKKK